MVIIVKRKKRNLNLHTFRIVFYVILKHGYSIKVNIPVIFVIGTKDKKLLKVNNRYETKLSWLDNHKDYYTCIHNSIQHSHWKTRFVHVKATGITKINPWKPNNTKCPVYPSWTLTIIFVSSQDYFIFNPLVFFKFSKMKLKLFI